MSDALLLLCGAALCSYRAGWLWDERRQMAIAYVVFCACFFLLFSVVLFIQ